MMVHIVFPYCSYQGLSRPYFSRMVFSTAGDSAFSPAQKLPGASLTRTQVIEITTRIVGIVTRRRLTMKRSIVNRDPRSFRGQARRGVIPLRLIAFDVNVLPGKQ